MSSHPLFDYLESTGPFAGLELNPWRCPTHPDWTAQDEELVATYLADPAIQSNRLALPVWKAKDALLKRWRERQRAGDTTPRVREWGEWLLTLPDDVRVAVVWDPLWIDTKPGKSVHVEFHGEISETGYRSELSGDWPKKDEHLMEWLIEAAKGFRTEIILQWEKEHRPAPRRRRSRKRSASMQRGRHG